MMVLKDWSQPDGRRDGLEGTISGMPPDFLPSFFACVKKEQKADKSEIRKTGNLIP
jgi:hypothetical protein